MIERAGGWQSSARSHVSDVVVIVVSVVLGYIAASTLQTPEQWPSWLGPTEQVVGVVACLSLWWRKTHPIPVAWILVVAGAALTSMSLAPLFALYAVAALCSTRVTVLLTAANLIAVVGPLTLRPDLLPSPVLLISVHIVGVVSATALGLVVRSRRELVDSLRARAVAAETEAQLRASQAEHEAREELAREMHDVLGHRLSLLSIQSGALSYNPHSTAADIGRAAEEIRRNAALALHDLREVLGLLRSPDHDAPLPKASDIPALVSEVVASGTIVHVRDDDSLTANDSELPAVAGRTLFRFVQEGLTNIRKHAPGTAASLTLQGSKGRGIQAELRNPIPTRTPHSRKGMGLTGLTERAALVGGSVTYGPTGDNEWSLILRLPWAP